MAARHPVRLPTRAAEDRRQRRVLALTTRLPGSGNGFLSLSCTRILVRMPDMDASVSIAASIALGIGLAAAVGFRVFLPLLIASVAAYTGHLHLAENFAWLGSLTAITTRAVASLVEGAAFYVPAGVEPCAKIN